MKKENRMEKVRLGDVCEITNGFAFKSEKYVSEGARVIRITNVQKGKIVDNDPKFYSLNENSNLLNYKIFENDILMSLTGNVGRVGRFPTEMLPAFINQRVCRLKSKSELLDEEFLFQFLNSDIFEREAVNNSSGAAQLNLSTKWIEDYKIPLPPLEEQKRIATLLDTADVLRQKDKALLQKYDALAQSLFLELFGDLVRNEKGWESSILEDICQEIVDCPHSTPKKIDQTSIYPCIRTSEIKNSNIDWKKMQYLSKEEYDIRTKRLIPIAGDIVYAREGSYGDAVILPPGYFFSLGQRTMLLRSKEEIVDPIFLHRMLVSDFVYSQARKMNSGSTVGHVNVKDVKKFNILVPPLELQNQFAEQIQLIEKQKVLVQENLAKSAALFMGLLGESFN